jgi:protein phosphatase 1 regulatory subunit 37
VLKRNKTLKVLNLSDNKIDAAGLQVLAQALVSILLSKFGIQRLLTVTKSQKLNNTLETLDLSQNPCCGPVLDGVGFSCFSFLTDAN